MDSVKVFTDLLSFAIVSLEKQGRKFPIHIAVVSGGGGIIGGTVAAHGAEFVTTATSESDDGLDLSFPLHALVITQDKHVLHIISDGSSPTPRLLN
jgi:hypothetical protein